MEIEFNFSYQTDNGNVVTVDLYKKINNLQDKLNIIEDIKTLLIGSTDITPVDSFEEEVIVDSFEEVFK